MRWWHRLIVTLLLAPVIWRVGVGYLANQTGTGAADLWRDSPALIGKIYLVYSLPAVALLLLVLIPAERMLKALGLDLLVVAVAPLLAAFIAYGLVAWLPLPQLPAEPLWLFLTYGLVWGLSIREPRDAGSRAHPAR